MTHLRSRAARVLSGLWLPVAVRAGRAVARLSRALGTGDGAIIGGRVTLRLHPGAPARLGRGRRVVLVSGTNGKTTTSHLLAAALGIAGRVAHNATGANMADGAVAALSAAPRAPYAVLEVDELHLARIAAAVTPEVVVLLNLTRDQLDRAGEVRAVAAAIRAALGGLADTTVVANADDPMVVAAADQLARTVWVGAGTGWVGDATSCPRCAARLVFDPPAEWDRHYSCAGCGFLRPMPSWGIGRGVARTPVGRIPLRLRLPGRFNLGNAVMALAAAHLLGISPHAGAAVMTELGSVAGRYTVLERGPHKLRMLLAKNPAGWSRTLELLQDGPAVLIAVNARQADGRDTSWLWDIEFERLAGRAVVACGERAADVGLRLSYAGVEHHTLADPLAGLALLPPGKVDVVANYTAFHQLRRRLTAPGRPRMGGPAR